ncbi:MAG: hotdog fold thioesterase [Actinobacteria bacterium]|nr:hotdog fold thioesterase [Actinomycetota bacterium]MBT6970114.1 hotdog fold thioesterase [Actinomycetota bacterium]MBT7132825.1 hotdog fold thioesterase [Actinomycetota bacterium]MBT7869363.1 hotdog fold thioesterase [Actinomycetota bacterium]
MFVNDPVAKKLGANLLEWGSGKATVELAINKYHTNFLGSGHGGVLFTLGDIAFSYACNSYGRKSLAIHVSLDYHRVASGSALAFRTDDWHSEKESWPQAWRENH